MSGINRQFVGTAERVLRLRVAETQKMFHRLGPARSNFTRT